MSELLVPGLLTDSSSLMKTVVITGASQGIGRAIAERFAGAFAEEEAGVRLALLARTAPNLEAVAEACEARGAEARALPCDVTDDTAVLRAAHAVKSKWGAPDVLVNNAGAFTPSPLRKTSPEAFRQQIDVNLTAAFVVTRAFLNEMVERGNGHLFYMGSVAGLRPYPGSVAYCAAKHGLRGLAGVVREETKNCGLRVTTLFPGATRTASWDGTELPEERFIPPEDVAAALVDCYRLSDRTVVEELLLRPQEGDV